MATVLNGLMGGLVSWMVLSGCATKSMRNPTMARDLIFPYGTYQHEVDLTLSAPPADPMAASARSASEASVPAGASAVKSPEAKALSGPREVHFHGLVKLSADAINLVALSPMNTTLFRVHEDRRSGQIETHIYVDSLQKLKSQMADYYTLIRQVLTAPAGAPAPGESGGVRVSSGPGVGLLERMSLQTAAGPAEVSFEDYDENRVPARILVESQRFKLRIRVSGYEL